jgi:hypothetical protein
LFAAATPILPLLLTHRVARSAHRKGLARRFWRSVMYVVLFNAAWSAGEACGYLLGPTKDRRIY